MQDNDKPENTNHGAAAHCHLQQTHRFPTVFAALDKTMQNSLLQRKHEHGTNNALSKFKAAADKTPP